MDTQVKVHITADWENDQSVVDQIIKWNQDQGEPFSMEDSSNILEDMESEWSCFVRETLKEKIQKTDIFLLIMGEQTNLVQDGSCFFCENYRGFSGVCAHGRTADTRGIIEFQCDMAREFQKKIVVVDATKPIDRGEFFKLLVE